MLLLECLPCLLDAGKIIPVIRLELLNFFRQSLIQIHLRIELGDTVDTELPEVLGDLAGVALDLLAHLAYVKSLRLDRKLHHAGYFYFDYPVDRDLACAIQSRSSVKILDLHRRITKLLHTRGNVDAAAAVVKFIYLNIAVTDLLGVFIRHGDERIKLRLLVFVGSLKRESFLILLHDHGRFVFFMKLLRLAAYLTRGIVSSLALIKFLKLALRLLERILIVDGLRHNAEVIQQILLLLTPGFFLIPLRIDRRLIHLELLDFISRLFNKLELRREPCDITVILRLASVGDALRIVVPTASEQLVLDLDDGIHLAHGHAVRRIPRDLQDL